jgi:hypothetical protein
MLVIGIREMGSQCPRNAKLMACSPTVELSSLATVTISRYHLATITKQSSAIDFEEEIGD